jgi:hypothetical protein
LIIVPDPVGGLVVASRTYNAGPDGTYGQGLPAVTADDVLGAGSELLSLIALNNTPRYRTNLGIAEVAGQGARVGVQLLDASGSEVLGYRELELAPHQQFQTNIFASMGLGNSDVVAASALIQVISGEGQITAYASSVDNATGDGTTLPPPVRVEALGLVIPEGE